MLKEIANIRGLRGDLAPSTALQNALTKAFNDMGFGLGLAQPLSDPMARALSDRAVELDCALQAGPRERIPEILFTLEDMPARTDSDPAMGTYSAMRDIEDLADVPAWALERAATAFRRAETGDGRFRPTAGQLRAWTNRLLQPLHSERLRIATVLLVQERLARRCAGLNATKRETTLAERRAIVDRMRAVMWEPPSAERADARAARR